MLKKVSVAALCVAIGSSLAFAAPSKSDTRDLLLVLSGAAFAAEQATTTGEQDLLAITSAGALTSASVGVHQLNAAEMDEVNGGKLKVSVKIRTNPLRIKASVRWE